MTEELKETLLRLNETDRMLNKRIEIIANALIESQENPNAQISPGTLQALKDVVEE